MSTTQTAPKARLWFVRRGEVVRGPFQTTLVKRYLILGRLRQTDEVSLDREAWQPVSAYPMFSPARLAEESANVLQREDERKPGDRRQNESPDNLYKERRSGTDRRAREAPEIIERRQRRARVVASLKPTRQSNLLPGVVIAVIVTGIIVTGFLFKPDYSASTPDCTASGAPQVNWANCRLEEANLQGLDLHHSALRNARLTGANLAAVKLSGSDVAYADLVGTNLSGADLTAALLKGAALRKADLSGARFDRADLSYADLTDAVIEGTTFTDSKLDNAIWVDGRTCAVGSVGQCN